MKLADTKWQLFLTIILGALIASGCVGSSGNQFTSRVQFGLQLDSLQNPQVAINGDSLRVDNFRFVYGDGSIILQDSSIALVPDEDTYTSFSVPNNRGQNPILISRGPVQNNPTYTGFTFSVQQAPDDNSNIDADFTDSNHNYSMIIDGSYNGSDFTFRSNHTFKDVLNFSSVQVQENNQIYNFFIVANVTRWFLGDDGGFLDPSDDGNKAEINNNIERSFTIDVNLPQN